MSKYEPDEILVRYEEKPVWAYKRHISRFRTIFPDFFKELQRRYYNTLEGRLQRYYENNFLAKFKDDIKILTLPPSNGATIKFYRPGEVQ